MPGYKEVELKRFFFYMENYYVLEKESTEKEKGRDGLMNLLIAIAFKAKLHRMWYSKHRSKAILERKNATLPGNGFDLHGNRLPEYDELDITGKGTPLQLIKRDFQHAKNRTSSENIYFFQNVNPEKHDAKRESKKTLRMREG